MITPNGRGLGRLPDKKDERDRKYSAVRRTAPIVPVPARVDLSAALPPCFDQGKTSSCGPNSASALLCYLTGKRAPFSRLQIYYGVRAIENDIENDSGVECRDLFRVLQVTGAAPESLWPFDPKMLFTEPPDHVYEAAGETTIDTYSRLESRIDYLQCLAAGFPFILGFTVFESLDSDEVKKSGVLPMPIKGDEEMGGHAVLVVGYDTEFYKNKAFLDSGLKKSQVSGLALKIRNSWGPHWGLNGHCWMPIDLASGEFGADAWTARLASAVA